MTASDNKSVLIPSEDACRQAVRSIGGYAYQLYCTVEAWLKLPAEAILAVEVAEDYLVLLRGAVEQVQVKDTQLSGNVTLRSEGVRKLIESHVRLLKANPAKRVSSTYLTTSHIGKERDFDLLNGVAGLSYWNRVVASDADAEALRTALLSVELDEGTKEFIKTAVPVELRMKLIDAITWNCEADNFETVRQRVGDALVILGTQLRIPSDEAERLEDALLGTLVRLVVTDKKRELTRADLLRTIDSATKLSFSRSAVERIFSVAAGTALVGSMLLPPSLWIRRTSEFPLPPRTASRTARVTELRDRLPQSGCLWLHGSTGSGKTTLGLFIARSQNHEWLIVDLNKCTSDDCKNRLTALSVFPLVGSARGIILDDAPPMNNSSLIATFCALANELKNKGIALLVTSAHAPIPELRSRLGTESLDVIDAPYLSEDDIGTLVVECGQEPSKWAKAIHLFTAGGHPLLVDGAIGTLDRQGWSDDALLELVPGQGDSSELQAQRRAAIVRLKGELPEDVRRLLYRLSLAIGTFDRRLAISIALANPEIDLAGEKFDSLLGPWIELRSRERFAVSPLIAESGSQNLNPQEQAAVRQSMIYDLISRRPFPGDQLSQLFWASIIEQNRVGLAWFAEAMLQHLMSDPETFLLLAREVSVFPLFRMERLCSTNEYLSAMLRIVQFFVAIEVEEDRASKIFDRAVAECRGLEDSRIASSLLILLASKALMRRNGILSPKQWLPLVLELDERITDIGNLAQSFEKMLKDANEKVLYRLDQFLFVCQASALQSLESLSELFEGLDQLGAPRRAYFLDALNADFHGRRLMIGNPWQSEARTGTLNGACAAVEYERLSEIAKRWSQDDLVTDCLCAQAIVLDEYALSSTAALSVIDRTIAMYGATDKLLHRKQVVLYGLGRHQESLDAFPNIVTALPDDPIDHFYALRYAAISAWHVSNLDLSSALFEKAAEVAFRCSNSMTPLAIGSLADAAVVQFGRGHYEQAIQNGCQALKHADSLDPNLGSKEKYCSIILGHLVVCFWQASQKPDTERMPMEIKPGVCSNPTPNQEILDRPLTPNLSKWYLLALAELELVSSRAAIAELRTRTHDIGILPLEFSIVETMVRTAIKDSDVLSFMASLPVFLQLGTKISEQTEQSDPTVISKLSVEPVAPLNWADQKFRSQFIQAIITFALSAVVRNRCSAIHQLVQEIECKIPQDSDLKPFLSNLAGETESCSEPEIIKLTIGCIRMCARFGSSVKAEELFRITYYLWCWLLQTTFQQHLETEVSLYLCRAWQAIISERRFQLTSPNIYVPSIQSALDGSETGALKLARIMLAANGATHAAFGTEITQQLETFVSAAAQPTNAPA